ncbi:hypothetical protein EV700_1978 [Fluviicoccus keumensis]|uniref:Uncharacterized protein n=1 Tax=Fluviicoccus keumensis TaxID=1435465 RepID=A0A4Q7Z645_9GAMM|nr:hypothetical protein EV700_1978 [Fluviicoccus keumensis]
MEIMEWREEQLNDELILADDCDYYVDDAVEL